MILAGEKRVFFHMPLGSVDVDVWRKLDIARRELKFHACYCSVFDECWTSNLVDLEPKRVAVCPVPKVPYIE